MVVTDDEVYAMLLGVGNLLVGLYSAVEDDDELHPCGGELVDCLGRYPVALLVAGRDEVIYVGVEVLEILVDQGDGGSAVDIIVAVDHYLLL